MSEFKPFKAKLHSPRQLPSGTWEVRVSGLPDGDMVANFPDERSATENFRQVKAALDAIAGPGTEGNVS